MHVWLAIWVLAALAAFASDSAGSGSASPPAIPRPTLPSWIEDVSPSGGAAAGSQVRIRFRDALIAVPGDAASRADVLAAFHLTPAASGEFRLITPRLVTFEADAPLVAATRYRVTMDRGLSDLAGHRLDAPLSWTFDMAPIVFALSKPPDIIDTEPRFVIRTNARFDDASLDGRMSLEGGGRRIAVRFARPAWFADRRKDEPLPYVAFASASTTLEADMPYSLVVDSGVTSLDGNLESRRQVVASFRTRGPLRLLRAGHVGLPDRDGLPGRFIDGAPALLFDNPIDAKTMANGITLTPPLANPGMAFSVSDVDDDGVHISAVRIDPAQLAPDTAYVATVNTELADGYGQHATPSSVAFRTGVLPGTIEAPPGLTLVPPSAPPIEGTAFGVPDGFARLSSRSVKPGELVYDGTPEEALPAPETWSHVVVPAKGTATFPLDVAAANGLSAFAADAQSYRYSDEFGDAHDATTRVAGFVQRTDLGIFAESVGHVVLVRVSHLHDGSPVAGAGVSLLPMVEHRKANEPVVPCADGRTRTASGFRRIR